MVEDIGGNGPFCPSERRSRNYRNSPRDWRLSPGTFVWRPSRDSYFVEAPKKFSEKDMLYHPVKAGVPEWRGELAATPTRPSTRGAPAIVSVAMSTYNGAAAEKCRGDLIFFCDQDDRWAPDKISTIHRAAAASAEQVFSHDISVFSETADLPSLPSYFAYLRRTGFSPAACVKGCATAVRSEFIRDWGWPGIDSGVAHDFWVALLATAFRQRRYIDQPLVEHRLHGGNASGWIASDADRARSARWSAVRRQRQSDQDLLIELCIKRWNLDWTDEFLRVLVERRGELAEDLSSDFLAGLRSNRRYHSSSLHRPLDRISAGGG